MLKSLSLLTLGSLCCLDMAFAQSRVDLVYHAHKDRPLYEGRAFMPIASSKNALLFGDVRAVTNLKNNAEFNLGIGLRHQLVNSNTVLGAYYFYDRRHTPDVFQQNTIGGEIFLKNIAIRGNLYKPIASSYATSSVKIAGDSTIKLDTTTNTPMKGKDAEIGIKLSIGNGKELWFYGGAYKFTGSAVDKGKKIRVEFDTANSLQNGLNFSTGVEYDYNQDKSKRKFTCNFRIGIPFTKYNKSYTHTNYNMVRPIVRDIDIKIDSKKTTEAATAQLINTKTGDAVTGVDKVNKISEVTNHAEFVAASEVSGSGANARQIILAKNDLVVLAPVTLATDQHVVGQGTVKFTGATSNTVVYHHYSPQKPIKLSYIGADSTLTSKTHGLDKGKVKIIYDADGSSGGSAVTYFADNTSHPIVFKDSSDAAGNIADGSLALFTAANAKTFNKISTDFKAGNMLIGETSNAGTVISNYENTHLKVTDKDDNDIKEQFLAVWPDPEA